MEFKQRLKQWSPFEPDHGLMNTNSSIDTTGLHSTLYSEFNESEQEAVRALASLSNSHNNTPFFPHFLQCYNHKEQLLCLLHVSQVHCQRFHRNQQ